MMTEQIKTVTRTRAVRKGLITQDFKLLDSVSEDEFNVPLLDQYINSIESVDNFNISLAPRERVFILTNKQQKCAIAMLC